MTPLLVDQREAAGMCSVGLTFFRAQILPDLRAVRRGRRLLIPVAELEKWIAREAA